eukprot:9054467-Pyramimonas_sp.AAC.1
MDESRGANFMADRSHCGSIHDGFSLMASAVSVGPPGKPVRSVRRARHVRAAVTRPDCSDGSLSRREIEVVGLG